MSRRCWPIGSTRHARRRPCHPGSALAIPAPFTSIVGRGTEHDRLIEMLGSPGVRLVTIVGPGGIGKSRLAIEVAETIAQTGREVAFAMLESVATPERVISMIARAVGVRDTGDEPLEAKLLTALAGRDLLLVVDNMEHVIDATADLVRLITALPRLQLLVTSRSPLRVRAERTFELGPLAVPDADASMTDAAATSAVALFVDRAMAINPAFQLSEESAGAIGGIVRALDGVPLAIELAAARTRTMSPQEILERLDSALSLLVGGARDLPERQRTVRSTIEWSVAAARRRRDRGVPGALGVRRPVHHRGGRGRACGIRHRRLPVHGGTRRREPAVAARARRRARVRHARSGARVRARSGGCRGISARARRERWVAYYVGLASQAPMRMRASDQLSWMRRLDAEAENLAAVMRHLLDSSRLDEAAEYAWSLYLYLWIDGLLGAVRNWMTELLERAERDGIPLAPRTEAIALYFTRAVAYWQDPGVDVLPGLQSSAALFDEAGDAAERRPRAGLGRLAYLSAPTGPDLPAARAALEQGLAGFSGAGDSWGQAMTLVTLGRIDLADARRAGRRGAVRRELPAGLRRRARCSESSIAQHHRGWPKLFSGDIAGAEEDFAESLDTSVAMHHDEGIAYGLEGLAGVRAAQGDAAQAGLLRRGRADPASAHGIC